MRTLSSEFIDGKWFVVIAGDGSETKPTDDICDGSVFIETDSTDKYIFNEKTSTWVEE